MTPTFDRFDICEAYAVLEWDYNQGGALWERIDARKMRAEALGMEATHVQMYRIGFKPRPDLSYRTLTPNGKAIYNAARKRLKLPKPRR